MQISLVIRSTKYLKNRRVSTFSIAATKLQKSMITILICYTISTADDFKSNNLSKTGFMLKKIDQMSKLSISGSNRFRT